MLEIGDLTRSFAGKLELFPVGALWTDHVTSILYIDYGIKDNKNFDVVLISFSNREMRFYEIYNNQLIREK